MEEKPVRDYWKTYIAILENSPGTKMFRNFFVSTAQQGLFDAMNDGDDSCAFFVSSMLSIMNKIDGIHGTVGRVIEELHNHEWQEVSGHEPKPGDVIVWSPQDGKRHIGFVLRLDQAISTSSKTKEVTVHSIDFDGTRPIESLFRMNEW